MTEAVQAAVEGTAYSFDALFTYLVPEELCGRISAGMRVVVPFGRGNRSRIALVFAVEPAPADRSKLKYVSSIADSEPVISPEMVRLCKWIRDNTFCTYFDAFRAILPPGLSYTLQTRYEPVNGFTGSLTSGEQSLLTRISELREKYSPQPEDKQLLKALKDSGAIKESELLKRRVGDETTLMVKLAELPEGSEPPKLTPKQKQVLEREITSIRSVLEMLEDGRQTQNREETELGNRLQEIMQSSVFASEEEMCGYAVSEEKIAREEQQINDYRLRVRTNEVQLEQAQKEAEGKEYIDAEKLQREVCVQEANREELYRKENEIVFRIKNNQEKKKNIESRRAELEQAKKEYLVCTRLYQLVRGQTGNGKITLEQYVQAAGFDRIILAANKRLLPMSDGQYELYRQQDNAGRRSNTFLDLEVLDHYTGHRRPVGNLSGGESFKASLSLALGLSDSISSSLGGIQMDALFVDEGFGTLDRKSMENAMEILTHLSEKNKLVGIISHREELVENIPQQIRVKKTREGSRIEVESEY